MINRGGVGIGWFSVLWLVRALWRKVWDQSTKVSYRVQLVLLVSGALSKNTCPQSAVRVGWVALVSRRFELVAYRVSSIVPPR